MRFDESTSRWYSRAILHSYMYARYTAVLHFYHDVVNVDGEIFSREGIVVADDRFGGDERIGRIARMRNESADSYKSCIAHSTNL